MKWTDALKIWNEGKGTWCVPKKGTDAHAEVMKIVNGGMPAKASCGCKKAKDKCGCGKKEPKEMATKKEMKDIVGPKGMASRPMTSNKADK